MGLLDAIKNPAYSLAANAIGAANRPTKYRRERKVTWEKFTSASGWTTSDATVALDTTNYQTGGSALKVTATSTTGTAGHASKTTTLPQIGQYMRVRCYIPDLTKVARIGLLWFTGATGNNAYYSHYFEKSAGGIVEGWQTFDFHADRRPYPGATPDPDELITLIRVYVYPESGDTAEATFDLWENASRKPAILFTNDEPYLEFTDYVAPLLADRNLPFTIQLRQLTVDAWTTWPHLQPTGKSSLNELATYRNRGLLDFGLHFDYQQATDAEFYADALALYRTSNAIGLLPPYGLHVTHLQGEQGTQTRTDYVRQFSGTARRGSSAPADDLNDQGLIPPGAGSLLYDVPVNEFNHLVNDATVTGWIDTAIEQETILYVFGHGTDELDPGADWRTPLTVYEAFLEHFDSVSDQIDWLSWADYWALYHDASPTRNNEWSYTE